MAKIKQIKVYSQSNSSWKTGDIGADASNIDLASAVNSTATNVEDAIQYLNQNISSGRNTQITYTEGSYDLNDFITEGCYYFANTCTITNQPNSATNGWLEVYTCNNAVKQFWHRHGNYNTNFVDEYVRLYGTASGITGWSAWERIATESYAVAKAGDTMTGNLTIENSGLNYTTDNFNFTLGTSRSGNQYFGGIYCNDNQGTRVFYSQQAATTSGSIYRSYVVTAKDSSNNTHYNGFYLHINSSGNAEVSLTGSGAAAAWRSAIGAQQTLTAGTGISISGATITSTGVKDSANTSAITFSYASAGLTNTDWFACWNGYQLRAINPTNARNVMGAAPALGNVTQKSNSAVNVATGTYTTLGNTGSLAAGTYIIIAAAEFAANSTGQRRIFISSDASATSGDIYNSSYTMASPGYAHRVSFMALHSISSATTYYLRAWQNSKATLSVYSGFQIIKLK